MAQDTQPLPSPMMKRMGLLYPGAPSRRMEMNKAAFLGNLNSSLCLSDFYTECKLCLRPECGHAKIT